MDLVFPLLYLMVGAAIGAVVVWLWARGQAGGQQASEHAALNAQFEAKKEQINYHDYRIGAVMRLSGKR